MQAHDTDEWEWMVENGADPVCSSADLHKARSMWTRHHPSVECPSPQLMQPRVWPELWHAVCPAVAYADVRSDEWERNADSTDSPWHWRGVEGLPWRGILSGFDRSPSGGSSHVTPAMSSASSICSLSGPQDSMFSKDSTLCSESPLECLMGVPGATHRVGGDGGGASSTGGKEPCYRTQCMRSAQDAALCESTS